MLLNFFIFKMLSIITMSWFLSLFNFFPAQKISVEEPEILIDFDSNISEQTNTTEQTIDSELNSELNNELNNKLNNDLNEKQINEQNFKKKRKNRKKNKKKH